MRNLLLLLLVLASSATAQPYRTAIYYHDTTTYMGGGSYRFSSGSDVSPAPDGGYFFHYILMEPAIHGWYGGDYTIKTDSNFQAQYKIGGYIGSRCFADGSFMQTWLSPITPSTCTNQPIQLYKFNLDGSLQWERQICNDLYAWPHSVHIVNNKVKIFGTAQTPGHNMGFVYDVDSAGTTVYSADSFNVRAFDNCSISQVFTDDSGNCYIELVYFYPLADHVFIKMRPDNSIAWCQSFRIHYPWHINSLVTLSNGDVLFGGNIHYGPVQLDRIFLARFSPTGECKWQKTTTDVSHLSAITVLPGDDLILTCVGSPLYESGVYDPIATPYNFHNPIIRTDSALNIKWTRNTTPFTDEHWPYFISMSAAYVKSPNELVFAGTTKFPNSGLSFSTDSTFSSGICTTEPYTPAFTFHSTTVFNIIPDTVTIGPFAANFVDTASHPLLSVPPPEYSYGCTYSPPPLTLHITTANPTLLDVSLYPNPATDVLHISITTPAHISIFDMAGRTMHQAHISTPTIKINTTDLATGNYIIRITPRGAPPIHKKLTIIH